MTTVDHRAMHQPELIAAAARSVLASPASIHLLVSGMPESAASVDQLEMQENDGTPTFACPPGSELALAGAVGPSALLTLQSGLGASGSAERRATLTLAGRLEIDGREECGCCGDLRDLVTLRPTFVLLSPDGERSEDPSLRVPLECYHSPEHRLNRGYLQRSVEHANRCHQDELRLAVSSATGTPIDEIAGVSLTGLRPDRVEVTWVGRTGARRRTLLFSRVATSIEELGRLLRTELHSGIC